MQSLSKHLDPDKQKIARDAQESVMKQRSDLQSIPESESAEKSSEKKGDGIQLGGLQPK
jgi:hypothetical protein